MSDWQLSENAAAHHELQKASESYRRAGTLLKKLNSAVKALPQTVSLAPKDGVLAKTFTNHPGNLDDEGLWYSFNKLWERVFHSQKPEAEKTALVLRGKYGLALVVEFIDFYKDAQGMTEATWDLMCGKIEHLLEIIAVVSPPKGTRKKASVSTATFYSATASSSKPAAPVKKRVRPEDDDSSELSDGPIEPAATDAAPARRPIISDELADKVLGITEMNRKEAERENGKGKGKGKGKAPGKGKETARKPKKRAKANSGSSGSEGEVEVVGESGPAAGDDEGGADAQPVGDVVASHKPTVAEWAQSHFTPVPAFDKKNKQIPVWQWVCNWCGGHRTSPRSSASAQTFVVPPESNPASASNWSRHLHHDCKKFPPSLMYETWLEQREAGQGEPETVGRVGGLKSWVVKGSVAVEQAKKQPLTRRRWREVFVKGLIEDDLPFTFGEKGGMRKVFATVLPKGYKVPDRKMVRRDLDTLHAAMVSKSIKPNFAEHKGRIAIAVDGWGSKNSVYSFIGIIAIHIDDNWRLIETPLDLLPLDEDHSGKVYAKEIVTCLHDFGISSKFIGNTSDNTSTNGVMNRGIAKRLNKRFPHLKLDASTIDIGCAVHVINLSCQDVLYGVGAAPSSDKVDMYVDIKAHGLAPETYAPENDEDLREEEKLQKAEIEAEREAVGVASDHDERSSDSDDSEYDDGSRIQDDDGDASWADDDEADVSDQPARKATKKRRCRISTPVTQIHELVVHVLRSSTRRHRFRRIVRRTCPKEIRHLTLIRSMRVRWNSVHAELQRARLLRPAISSYLESLPVGLTGKKKKAAQAKQKRLSVSVSGWEMVDTMVTILKPFEDATKDLSVSGVPTLCMVLPVFKSLQEHLEAQIASLTESLGDEDEFNLVAAVQLGLDKLNTYLDKALKSDYHLLAVVLNPQLRLQYFEDDTRWDPEVPVRARALLEKLCEQHSRKVSAPANLGPQPTASSSSTATSSLYLKSVRRQTSTQGPAAPTWTLGLESYLNGAYPFPEDKGADHILSWWSAYGSKFTPLDSIARDILAILGVSVPVERLFSSSGLTLRDNRARMTAVTAGKTVIAKEWLKRGLGDDINHLEDVRIWEKESSDESE